MRWSKKGSSSAHTRRSSVKGKKACTFPPLALFIVILPNLRSLENYSQCACAAEEQPKRHLLAILRSWSSTGTQLYTTLRLLLVQRQSPSTPISDEEFASESRWAAERIGCLPLPQLERFPDDDRNGETPRMRWKERGRWILDVVPCATGSGRGDMKGMWKGRAGTKKRHRRRLLSVY